jgi:hypothetical protein
MASKELYNTKWLDDTTLKAYYRFEAGALTTDSSGEEHTLTAISDPAETIGVFGGGVSLDSNDAYSRASETDLKPTTDFTIGAWIKRNGSGSIGVILQSWSNNSNTLGCKLQVNTTTGYLRLVSGKGGGSTQGTHWQEALSDVSVCNNAWRFCVGTWNSTTNKLAVYVDGVIKGSADWSNAPVYAATNYVRIGCENATGSDTNFFTGLLDDVFLINGKALSADEVYEMYLGRAVPKVIVI